jgi:hypothetical protein
MLLGGAQPTGYNLTRSLRFRASASAYLNRTGAASPTDYRKFTFSFWMKRGALSTGQRIIDSTASGLTGVIGLTASDELVFATISGGAGTNYSVTNNRLRDPSAWYHIVFSCDTSVGSNQFKFYVNGVEASYSLNNSTLLNYGVGINGGSEAFLIGRSTVFGLNFDGYFSEFNFIDGQALTPSSFGSTNALTGVWQPAPYTGTYGTNGFYLPFTDNSTAAALGTDFSGNSNTWTTNNISLTSGVTYDSMTDVPTLTSATATNYAVLNPLENVNSTYMSFKNGNLRADMGTGATTMCWSTVVMPTNKWYWEVTITTVSNGTLVGISYGSNTISDGSAKAISYEFDGNKRIFGAQTSYGSAYTSGDVIGIAVDKAASTITFYKNNVSQGAISNATIATQDYRAMLHNNTSGGSGIYDINFGQRPFTYTPPTGFVALNTFNLT